MDTRLDIVWDGHAPGLANHRISLDAFGDAMQLLLKALRRIASDLLVDATESSGLGRLHKQAKWIDIEIEGVAQSSAGISTAVVLHPPSGKSEFLFEDISLRSVSTLLSAIEVESAGEMRHATVRKYLKALPPEVTGQRYTFRSNGTTRTVEVGSMRLPAAPTSLPYLSQLTGFVTGVGFSPGKPHVYIDSKKCEATNEQVEAALELRGQKVVAFSVAREGSASRLLKIRAEGEEVQALTDEQRDQNVFKKWDELLTRLAQ